MTILGIYIIKFIMTHHHNLAISRLYLRSYILGVIHSARDGTLRVHAIKGSARSLPRWPFHFYVHHIGREALNLRWQ